MVLTFHVPSRMAGLFRCFLFPCLPGAKLTNRLSGFALSPTHPMRQTDRGETTPYWLGAAQFEAGGSCPVKF